MEHISDVIRNRQAAKDTPDQSNIKAAPGEVRLENRLEGLRKNLGISSLEHTFANFKLVKGTRKAYYAFKDLASGKTDWNMLLCYGGVGNGKTHLCEAAAMELYKRRQFVRVIQMPAIMGILKNAIDVGRFDECFKNIAYAERLILDDVAGTDWELEQLEKIILIRYRERLLTILTTNIDIGELPERIVSRFSDREIGRLVLNEGADYRPKKGN